MSTDVRRRAAELDAADPLAPLRDRYVGADTDLVYFDGNSLGRPLSVTTERLAAFIADEWGGRLIRGWDERWYDLPLTVGDRLGALCLGAGPGQVFVGDSTTVLLYKLIRAAVDAAPEGRDEIVIDTDNFPTDRYLVTSIAAERGMQVRWIDVRRDSGVTADLLADAVGQRTALVVLSHVAYRSAHLADGPTLTRIVQDAGAVVLWDLCHSAGSVEVALDDWGADLAVGCSYKYLNAGPGAPAFGYVATRHLGSLRQPITGWMGHADPFLMGPEWTPAPGVRSFISGTPPITGMLPLLDQLDVVEQAGIAAIRAKSVALTEFAIELTETELASYDVVLASPRDSAERGGHVTLNHPRMREVTQALWRQDVIPDYRDPDGLRLGLSPLSTSFAEVARGFEAIRAALA